MRSADLPEVRELDLFRSVSDSNFEDLLQAAYLQSFPAQVELIREGERADFLFVVMEGRVELYGSTNGRESTLMIVEPVSTFILAAVVRDAVYLMSARTCTKSRLLMIPASNVRAAFGADAAFAGAVVAELANSYRSAIKELKNQKLRTSVERLANKLLTLHVEQGGRGVIALPYDKRLLASLLGMAPENLSRAFNTLQPYGVSVNGSEIRLTNLADLETLAKPAPLLDDRSA
ncbi:MAG: cyclic nucleotide-binding domain-containing protein [Devosia sp.]|nr:cyclic nucleotide-binding domain-containing protein [Devosia sp.]